MPEVPMQSPNVQQPVASPEFLPSVGSTPSAAPPPFSGMPDPAAMQPLAPQPAAAAPGTTVAQVAIENSPVIADDADLIEKEWVQKAKEIVERTRLDPYQQNKEINKFKADYLKKRYNRDMLVADSQSSSV